MASNIVFDGTKGISLPSFTTTEKNAIVSPATGATVFDTTQNRQNVYAGGAWNAGLNSGTAVASTSGTSIDFTSIPSWVKRITVMFNEVSQNSASQTMIVQIGAGSVTTSGYRSGIGYTGATTAAGNVTAGFGVVYQFGAANIFSGSLVITLVGSNVWVASVSGALTDSAFAYAGGGALSLGGTLDRVRITTVSGTATFDAGSINILYE